MLIGVKCSGNNGWLALCPGHNDTKPSLSIKEADGKILLHCHAGCANPDILASMGLTMADMNHNGRKPVLELREVATYDYTDETGKLLYQVVRYDPKDFRQRQPDGNGGWLWNLKGISPVLYRLPEVSKAITEGRTVYICEGEKDCDNLVKIGLTATTNSGGAEKWRPEYAEALKGASVIILSDKDAPGKRHASKVATSLHGNTKSIKVVELPDRNGCQFNDVSDWLAVGGTTAEMDRLASETPEYKLDEPVDLAVLLDNVRGMLMRYIVLDQQQADAVTLWVAHTHTIEAAEVTPYLAITSAEKRCGKTRLLEVLDLLVIHPWLTGRTTAAALARKVDRDCPTLLLDESDAAFKGDKEYSETLRSVLNTGHRRGGKVTCCIGQGANLDFRDFSTFCPKAIAGIGKLPDTVSDRSIAITLKRRAPSEPIKRFRYRDVALEATPLRESLTRWASKAIPGLDNARPDIPTTLGDRAADGWEPLLAIADIAGGDWPERGRRAALALSVGEVHEDESLGVRLLTDSRRAFEEKGEDRLGTSVLLEYLIAVEEAPWGEWYGRPLTARGLAKLLKPFGIVPRTIRTGDETLKGYAAGEFHDAWSRYIPPLPVTASQIEIERKKASHGTFISRVVTDMPDSLSDMGPEDFEANVTDVTDRPAIRRIDNTLTPLTDGDTSPPLNNDLSPYPPSPCLECGGEWSVSPEGVYICENCGRPSGGES